MHRKVAAALAVALALALTSCGGGQETETVSRAQLISRLEAACLAGTRQAQRQAQKRGGITAQIEVYLVNLKKIDDAVGNLETTGRAGADFDAYKDTVSRRIDAFESIASADGAEQQRLVREKRAMIGTTSIRGREAIFALGARHVCI
jgi:hypothetical protein